MGALITWIFIVEMGLKLLGLGCAGYWADGWNTLDGTIVSVSIFDIASSALLGGGTGVKFTFSTLAAYPQGEQNAMTSSPDSASTWNSCEKLPPMLPLSASTACA